MQRTRRPLGRSVMMLALIMSMVLVGLQIPTTAQAEELVNLSHLEFLHDTVVLEELEPGHTTVDPEEPLDAWWTYADYDAETDTYRRVGGGAFDEATNTWGQGAYNLDDVARVAIVYLTHYRYYGGEESLELARGALRWVLYTQTLEGDNAGNFVLWMQPDGTLTPMPEPPDDPNPADDRFSWWAARALWAMAEGYDTLRAIDPEFAAVLQERIELAMMALDRDIIEPNYGTYINMHGIMVPGWFISDGADASSIATIGLLRYYEATGDEMAEELATALAEAISQFQLGDPTSWAFQALLPFARSLSLWHAWGVRMGKALALSGRVLEEPTWIRAAEREANLFLTHELVSIGPINGLMPSPADLVQINYGNEVLTNNLLALAESTGKEAYSYLAGLQATWWLGNNPAGALMYDPATGAPRDGIEPDGRVNMNAGAESTVSALLGVMNVDQDPIARDLIWYRNIETIVGWQMAEAEEGTISGDAEVVLLEDAWTGEALWSGGAYARLSPGGTTAIEIAVPDRGQYRLFIVYDKQLGPRDAVEIEVRVDGGPVRHLQGGALPPGDSPNESYLWMDSVLLRGTLQEGTHTVTLTGVTGEARVDAILLQPIVEYRILSTDEGDTVALAKSFAAHPTLTRFDVIDEDGATVRTFDMHGNLIREIGWPAQRGQVPVLVPRYGYAVVKGVAAQ